MSIDAASLTVPEDEVGLHVESLGTGPPVLILGGIHLSHDYLRPWLDPLAERIRLLFVDHRGTGRSGPKTDRERELAEVGHEGWVRDVEAIRRELGLGRVVVLGHSYGGFLALEYAVRHGERLAGLILSNTAPVFDFQEQVLANAAARGNREELAALENVFSLSLSTDGELEELWRRVLPLYFHRWDEARAERMHEDTTFSAAAFRRAYGACLPAYDVRDCLSSVRCPVLVLDGADDWVMPPAFAGERLEAGLPGAERAEFERSGHFPFVEVREQFLAVVGSWLARLDPAVRRHPVGDSSEVAGWA